MNESGSLIREPLARLNTTKNVAANSYETVIISTSRQHQCFLRKPTVNVTFYI